MMSHVVWKHNYLLLLLHPFSGLFSGTTWVSRLLLDSDRKSYVVYCILLLLVTLCHVDVISNLKISDSVF